MTDYLKRGNKPDLAYVYSKGSDPDLPLVMFCGGYASDMQGSKATYFEQACAARGQSYVRFDYAGHGQSGGEFAEGTIGAWRDDALAVFDHVLGDQVDRKAVIVGSSMGGWIGLLLCSARATHIAGYIGIAAAPDFTEELYYERLNDEQREAILREGRVLIPNDYSDDPYIFTRALFEDGKRQCVLGSVHDTNFPMHLFQGMQDKDVHPDTPKAIQKAYGDHVDVTYIEDGDHRLSRPQDLILIDERIKVFSEL